MVGDLASLIGTMIELPRVCFIANRPAAAQAAGRLGLGEQGAYFAEDDTRVAIASQAAESSG